MSKFDRNRIKDGWENSAQTNRQTDRQTDKQTGTTKIMVTWPWTKNVFRCSQAFTLSRLQGPWQNQFCLGRYQSQMSLINLGFALQWKYRNHVKLQLIWTSGQSASLLYFTMGCLHSPVKTATSHAGSGPSSNTWFLWLTWDHISNGNSISSAIFARLKITTDRKTDR